MYIPDSVRIVWHQNSRGHHQEPQQNVYSLDVGHEDEEMNNVQRVDISLSPLEAQAQVTFVRELGKHQIETIAVTYSDNRLILDIQHNLPMAQKSESES